MLLEILVVSFMLLSPILIVLVCADYSNPTTFKFTPWWDND